MNPVLLIAAGVVVLVIGVAVLQSIGPRVRVGRLLAATSATTIGEAIAIADRGESRFVRLRGRIDSDEEFEDAEHRPLVFRRTRLQARRRGRWIDIEDRRESVPFELHEGLDAIAIDVAAIDHGLVVLPRESIGVASEVPDRVPADLPATTPIRLRIEQVSSVEHAIVVGLPRRAGDRVELTAGLGRPLVLSTLEPDEAMRVIAEGRSRPVAAAALFAGGAALVVLGGLAAAAGAILR